MSAVCGIYHGDGRPVEPETGAAMMRELAAAQADAVGTWGGEEIFLGCRALHVTPESVRDTLPYRDESSGLTITADAIIDNRGELGGRLGIDRDEPDSRLILAAYRKWGPASPAYLAGDFAFAVWDENRRQLFCAVDHTGTRSFYYYRSAGLFAFATLIKPLLVLPGLKKEFEETWIADFLAMPSVMHQLDPELTLYKDIYLLPAGHTLTVSPGGAAKQVYWEVRGLPEIRLKSDREYEAALRDVLGEAVRCRLRSIRPVGVMMSGGLDSTSVASLAAAELAKGGKRLPVFTAVPMAGYRDWLRGGRLADESAYVEAVAEHTGNIDVLYCRSEGKHPLSETSRLLAMLEQPYKIFENLFWLDAIMAQARDRNIGVILSGSGGNSTISWGAVQPYLLYLLRAGRLPSVWREGWAAAKRRRRPLQALLQMLLGLLPYGVQKNFYDLKNPAKFADVRALSPINPKFARRIGVQERFRRFEYDALYINRLDSREARRRQLALDVFSHLGPLITKQGLAYGLALRDPTLDKRVVEFCAGVPENQYVRNGQERFLVRRAMAGFLPDMVRLNSTQRGLQSADWAQRLEPCWPQIAAEIRAVGILEAERELLDLARIQGELERVDIAGDRAPHNPRLRMLIRSLIFSRFLRQEGDTA